MTAKNGTKNGTKAASAEQRRPGSENLRPWKPGQSGNPAGRPKNAGMAIRECVTTMAADELTLSQLRAVHQGRGPKNRRAIKWRLAANLLIQSLGSKDPGIRALVQTIEQTGGKPKQEIENTGDPYFSITVERE